jgi:hypothetical protein
VIPFPATRRSVIERIRADDAEVRRMAFGDLAAGYWRPSYHYLRLHWRLAPEAAEDVVQAFFTVAFEKGYARVAPIPRASESTAVSANPGRRRNSRAA